MKRGLIAGSVSLLALLLVAPGARRRRSLPAGLPATAQMARRLRPEFTPDRCEGPASANRYSFHFATGFSGFTGTFSGKIFKRQGRGRVVANGILRVDQLDFPGGPTNCSSSGPRGWSAFTT